MPKLTTFREGNVAPAYDHPRPDRLVRGNPRRTTWTHCSNPALGSDAGLWACEPGAWNIAFPADKEEFFCVLEGKIRITDARGHAETFGPGESCVIPPGFTGTFEVLEAVRKYFYVVERVG